VKNINAIQFAGTAEYCKVQHEESKLHGGEYYLEKEKVEQYFNEGEFEIVYLQPSIFEPIEPIENVQETSEG
jgi:hypothetical protein